MRIVLPVSQSDSHLLPNWIEVVKHLKCGEQHDLTIVAARSVEGLAHDAKAELDGFFNSIAIRIIKIDPVGGWPRGSNTHFWYCAEFMAEHRNQPWLLCELDCLPLRQKSFDVVAARHMSGGTPFSGNVGKTPFRANGEDGVNVAENGKITQSIYGENDTMLSGCAVYPGDIMSRPNTSGLMADFMKGDESPDVGWDMYLRAAIKAEGVSHNECIGNHWNTENYRIENGRIVGDSKTTHATYVNHPNWEVRKCGGVVHAEAVMIHGCKDESLANLILGDKIPELIVAQPKKSQATSPDATQESGDSPTILALQEKLGRLEALLERVLTTKVEDAPKQEAPKKIGKTLVEVFGKPSDELQKVLDCIPEGKKIKMGTISEQTKIPLNRLRAIIKANQGMFSAPSGPASWIGRTNFISV